MVAGGLAGRERREMGGEFISNLRLLVISGPVSSRLLVAPGELMGPGVRDKTVVGGL